MKIIVRNSNMVFETRVLPIVEHLMNDAYNDQTNRVINGYYPVYSTGEFNSQSGINTYLYDISQIPSDATYAVQTTLNFSHAAVVFFGNKPSVGGTNNYIGGIPKSDLTANTKCPITVPSGTKWIAISAMGLYANVTKVYASYRGEPDNP